MMFVAGGADVLVDELYILKKMLNSVFFVPLAMSFNGICGIHISEIFLQCCYVMFSDIDLL